MNFSVNRLVAGAAVAVLLSTVVRAGSDTDWPQWRGPGRDGQVRGESWPDTLKEDALQPLWRIELGPSYSGPVVAGERVFTTETREKQFEVVTALDRATGKILWEAQWEGALSVPFFAKSNGDWIRSTPAFDDDTLFVAGMRDVLVALAADTGKQRWRLDFVSQLKTTVPAFGFVCSPLVDGDALYVQAGAAVARLKKATGELVWRALDDGGGMWGSAFSSPVIAELAGRRQLLVQTRTTLAGLDLASGAVLWKVEIPAFRGMNILTPVVLGNRVFTSSYGGKTLAFDVGKTPAGWQAEPAWSLKQQGYMSTPVVVDGHAYLHLRSQRLVCIDLERGEEKWTSGESFGKYWSLVAQGGRILGLDERGILYLVKASPAGLELLDSRKVADGNTWGHLAVSGRNLFIRELKALAAYRWSLPATVSAGP